MQRLPLFPLGAVLMPGLVMPLRVFEPRYLQLVEDLMAQPEDQRVFGVIAIREGHEVGEGNVKALYDVGCTAVVRDVTRIDDGVLELVTSGAVRFRLGAVDEGAATPYLTGLVEPVLEADGDDADVAGLARQVGQQFTAYRQQIGSPQVDLPDSPGVLSYFVASGTALELAERQSLLEQPDTARRLAAELRMLRRERVLFSELRAVPAFDLVRQAGMN